MEQSCNHIHGGSGPVQTLDEMDWERGLWGAAHQGDSERVLRLLRKKKDVNARDNSGYTALHYAARNGYTDVCKLLLKHGASINATTKEGLATALHRAASMGNADIVKLLLDYNADSTLQDADGKTPLHRAAEGQHEEVCKILVKNKPDMCSVEDKKGQLPFHYAFSVSLVTILNSHKS